MEVSFEKMTHIQLNEAFELLLYSVNNVRPYGFDYVDSECLLNLFRKLSYYHRKQIYEIVGIHDAYVTEKRLEDHFNEAYDDQLIRFSMWREVFKRAKKGEKVDLLESNERYYLRAKELKDLDYDWDEFRCILEDKGEISKLNMIKSGWNELGMQVYGCSTNDNGRMCPCLRHANTTTAYKCFRNYLEQEGKPPTGAVPIHMLQA